MKIHLILIGILWALPVLLASVQDPFRIGGLVSAAEEEEREQRESRQVPSMRERTYKALSEAQLMIDPESVQVEEGEEPPEPEGTPRDAINMLLELKDRRGLNSYEIAQIWNTLAFGYYTVDDTRKTINAYENVLAQEDITYALEISSLRALFQLYYSEENYRKALEYIDRWQALKGDPDTNVTFIKAIAYYELKEYQNALDAALRVEEIAREQGKEVKENWWYLQVVLYDELGRPDDVIRVLETLVVEFPKKQYWMHLASMYADKDWPDQALSAYYAAYLQGLLTKESELVMVAQRLLNAEVPYEASQVLQKGLDDGIIEPDVDNLKLLAQAYTMAQEMDEAISAWKKTTEAGDDGDLYVRLAQALSREDRHEEAVKAYRKALDAGDLRDKHDTQFWLGISLMQLEEWDSATQAFQAAAEDDEVKKRARQYIKYINSQKKREKELQRMLGAR